jgi:hypothetical protein
MILAPGGRRATSSTRALRATAWALGVLVALSPFALVAAPALASAPAATAVTLEVVPDLTPINDYTSVVVRSDVSPAAPGIVRVTDNGFILMEIAVVDGHATKRTILPIGDLNLVATFVPESPALWASSSSPALSVPVLKRPNIWLESMSGTRVPDGGKVLVGTVQRVVVDRLPPGFVISLQLTGTTTRLTITCDEQGTGRGQVAIPASLHSAVYRLEGPVDTQTAAFTFYVYNPMDATPTPSPTPVTPTPTPTPIATTPAQVAAGTPATATPSLAHTGWDDPAILLYAVAFGVLGMVLYASARPRRLGRHTRG